VKHRIVLFSLALMVALAAGAADAPCTGWHYAPLQLPPLGDAYHLDHPRLFYVNSTYFLAPDWVGLPETDPQVLLVSQDFINWQAVDLPTQSVTFYDIAYGNGRYVAATADNRYLTSTDGLTWTDRAGIAGSDHILWTGSEFVAFGHFGSIWSSEDGLEWSAHTGPQPSTPVVATGWSGSLWAISTSDGLYLSESLDGPWAHRTDANGSGFGSVAWGNGRFLLKGAGTRLVVTQDGQTFLQGGDLATLVPGQEKEMVVVSRFFFTGRRHVFLATQTDGPDVHWLLVSTEDGFSWSTQELPKVTTAFVFNGSPVWDGQRIAFVMRDNTDPTHPELSTVVGDCSGLAGGGSIAGVTDVTGYSGTAWRSDVWVENAGPTEQQVLLDWLPWGNDNTQHLSLHLQLKPGESRGFSDIVQTEFNVTGTGTVRITPLSHPLAVAARTYDSATGSGQGIPAQAWASAIAFGGEGRLAGLSESSDLGSGYRTNIGLINATTNPLDVRVRLYGSDGTLLGTVTRHLKPLDGIQLLRPLAPYAGSSIDSAYAILSTPTHGGRFFAYASRIDNASQDPTYIVPSAVTPPFPDAVP